MLVIDVKNSDDLDRAIKKYRKKHKDIGLIKELRKRQYFTKDSVTRRGEVLKAIYSEDKFGA